MLYMTWQLESRDYARRSGMRNKRRWIEWRGTEERGKKEEDRDKN